ncbi:hypothetical protein [Haloferax sp. DFSO52]|uniref:hypothetical protein n=1 Tax=Haloferax sp. DFSO52 TaxID=3388505 RepID=UPI003A86F10B
MASHLARGLRDRLKSAAIVVESERRGRDPWPGRPDSMFWLRPSGLAVGRLVPLLVELEGAGNYHSSKQDVRAFAKRHDPTVRPDKDGFQYHLNFPILDRSWTGRDVGAQHFTKAPAPMTVPVTYNVYSIPSSTVTGERATSDAELYQALKRPFTRSRLQSVSPPGFESDARIEMVGRTEIVFWTVDWCLPGGAGTVSVPFIVRAGTDLGGVLREVLEPVSLPMAAVIDGAPGAYRDDMQLETGVRLPYLSPANVTVALEREVLHDA